MNRAEPSLVMMEHGPDVRREPLHRHRLLEVGYCLRGQGTFYFGPKSYSVSSGDVIVVSPIESHRAQAAHHDPAMFLFVLFDPSVWLRGEPELLQPFLYHPNSFDNRIPGGSRVSQEIAAEISGMWNEYSQRERGFHYRLKSHLISICVSLLRHYEPEFNHKRRSAVAAYRKIEPLVEHLESSYAEPLTIERVATIVHLSPSRVQSLFKEALGVTFSYYLKSVRVQVAKDFLIRTERPVSDIAMRSGFQSTAAFYRAFLQLVGMKPLEYRNQYGFSLREHA